MSLNDTVAAPGAPWTPQWLGHALMLTAEEVLTPACGSAFAGATPKSRRDWAWIQTAQRLAERHGFDDALRRLNGYGHA